MDWSSLPAPSSYTDWQSWAAMLVQYLQSQGADSPVNIQSFTEDSSKDRNGLPVAADGDLIRVKDAEGNTSLKYWDSSSTAWEDVQKPVDIGTSEEWAHAAMPSSFNYLEISVIKNHYTAPADGYINVGGRSTAANQFFAFFRNDLHIMEQRSVAFGQFVTLLVPVIKGDVLYVDSTVGGSIDLQRFWYVNGATNA